MTTGIIHDQNLEKQIEKHMGCMAGFLQIFDRHQILTGKRLYSAKRLPPSSKMDSTEEQEKPLGSPGYTTLSEMETPNRTLLPSPDRLKQSPVMELRSPVTEGATPAEVPATSPLPLSVFEFKEGTRSAWKFKEAPRLSLDSRATVDARGSLHPRQIRTNAAILSSNQRENSVDGAANDDSEKQRRSPSVIARLMGLEVLPNSSPEPVKKAELRRSASESRVSRDLFQYRFIDGNNFQLKQPQLSNMGTNVSTNVIRRDNVAIEDRTSKARPRDSGAYSPRSAKSDPAKALHRGICVSPWKSPQQRKSFFETEDFFPGPRPTVSVYGEIERRLKMRGIDEPSQDLETLRQILEALQLKGLLHSKKPPDQINRRNFVYDENFSPDESPIVVMKPSRSPVSINPQRRGVNDTPPGFRSKPVPRQNLNHGESVHTVSRSRERSEIADRNLRNQSRARNSNSPTPSDNTRSTNSLSKRKPLNVETQRKTNDAIEQRRVSPIHSPKLSSKRAVSYQTISRSPRNRKPMTEVYPTEKIPVSAEDESSSISESSISTSSPTDTELQKSKVEDYREGRSLLERCDKLLHSIAEITATELQPSPVSVLDSSFYKDESSPSPVMKRCIDCKDLQGELEDENWNPAISPVQPEEESDNCDFVYISDILRVSNCLPEDSDFFLLLEKQQSLKGKDTSKDSRLQRRLIFDTINEILDRKKQLPPWKAVSHAGLATGKPTLQQIWLEFQRIRDVDPSEDVFEVICGVLRKDLAGDAADGWDDCPVEMSESVLDIERQIFKDLISETIQVVASIPGKINVAAPPRRRLNF
ncbi:protein LONGIFOLIA 1 isoform X2 [Malania oleifera]|uniref:protein LONGIFOLIA 1 isoform X2 n=1 Tax=Malania oleifera TaxID=397392 RepID=UPI0025ADB9D1|nr:protein LONGIFOLIA 1 isoform X2 [Malania oleifera]